MKARKILVGILMAILISIPLSAKVVKLDCNAIYGPTSIHTQGAMKFAEFAKKFSNGSILITVHPGGSLGFKGQELLKVVKDGQVPMSDILMGVVSGSEHVFGVSSLPKLVNSYKEARQLYEDFKPLYQKAAKKWNQKFLYAAPWPPSGLVTKKSIKSPADLKGLKTRTYDKNGAEFLRAMGGSPVALPWGEVYSSLRTGMIDSVLTSTESTKNGKFWEVLKYFTNIYYAFPLNMLTINLDYWNALSKDQQMAMLKAAKATEEYQWNISQKKMEDAAKIITQHGMIVENSTPALNKAMKKAAAKIGAKFLKRAKGKEKALLEKYLYGK